MNKDNFRIFEAKSLLYIKTTLCQELGNTVETPKGRMLLTELYSNGNVGCVPIICKDYNKELCEFHAESIRWINESGSPIHIITEEDQKINY